MIRSGRGTPRPFGYGNGGAAESGGPFETLFFTALAVAPAAGALVWAAGEVSGRLWGGAWPGTSAGEMAGVLGRLLGEPGTPAAAWPSTPAALIPGPVAFYGVLCAIAAIAAVPLAALWRVWSSSTRPGPRRGSNDGSRWASAKDLRTLVVRRADESRLVLGRAGRRLVATESRHSVLVVGPTQSGKTSSLAVPAILEWDGPVLATSVKTDLVHDTAAWRRTRGRVWVYDPTRTTGLESSGWSPLRASQSWRGALRMASWLCRGARSDGLEDADFWHLAAEKLLAPHLFAAGWDDRPMTDVLRWIDQQEVPEVGRILEAVGVPEALTAAYASWNREDRQRSSIYTTAETVLRAFVDPLVAESADNPTITPGDLLDGGANTLYVCAPAHEQDRLRPLFSALIHEMLTAVHERAGGGAASLPRPLLVVLDEAANIAPLRDLDVLASTAAGVGIQLVTVWQDLAQIEARYGRRAATVVNNHRAKIVLPGISDPRTLDHISRLVGDEDGTQESHTTDLHGVRSSTESQSLRRLLPADRLRRLDPGEAVLVYGHLLPARLRLRPWFKDKDLSKRAGEQSHAA